MTQLSPTALEAAAKAVEAAEFGYHLKLTSLIDGVSTYTLTYSDMSEPLIFSDTDTAYLHIADRKREVQTTAAITAYLAQMEKEGWVMVSVDRISAIWKEAEDCVPTNWCDGLLTGPKASRVPLDCPAVERLLLGIIKRIRDKGAAAQNGGG